MKMLDCSYDDNHVRYRLIKSNQPDNNYNWLFLPGGPGADSSYYINLIESLDVPGQFWLIDFPCNGDNSPFDNSQYNYDLWDVYFIPMIKRFENPILIGQSFGGMYPLLFPELESLLKGFIILNSAPRLWFDDALNYTKANNVTNSTNAGELFRANPTQETFKTALLANAHYHFPPSSYAKGVKLFAELPFNFHAMLWWIMKVKQINFDAKWIPQHIPTLIMGGTKDYIIPCSIFENDKRFQRDNVDIITVEDAGHFLWFDQPAIVTEAFRSLIKRITNY